MTNSKEILATFYKTHPTIHTQDWLSQQQMNSFMGNNRMTVRRKYKDIIKPYYLCRHPKSGKATKPLYLRTQIEDIVRETRIKNAKFDPLQFEKDKMKQITYYVSTKDYIPRCWLLELTKGYYKLRTKFNLTSRLDYPLIRSTKVFDQRWYNVEDIIFYIIEGRGTPIAENYKKLNLDIDVAKLQEMVDR